MVLQDIGAEKELGFWKIARHKWTRPCRGNTSLAPFSPIEGPGMLVSIIVLVHLGGHLDSA